MVGRAGTPRLGNTKLDRYCAIKRRTKQGIHYSIDHHPCFAHGVFLCRVKRGVLGYTFLREESLWLGEASAA